MPVLIKASDKSTAYKLLSQCEKDFSNLLNISDNNNKLFL